LSNINIPEDVLAVLADATKNLIDQKRKQLETVRKNEDANDALFFEADLSRCERALMDAEAAIYKSSL